MQLTKTDARCQSVPDVHMNISGAKIAHVTIFPKGIKHFLVLFQSHQSRGTGQSSWTMKFLLLLLLVSPLKGNGKRTISFALQLDEN